LVVAQSDAFANERKDVTNPTDLQGADSADLVQSKCVEVVAGQSERDLIASAYPVVVPYHSNAGDTHPAGAKQQLS
jgi:hypothetical protein